MPESEPYKQFEIKEGIVFLIDLSSDIFQPVLDLNNASQLLEVLRCINDLMSEMVVTSPKNGVGVYLYHSAETGKKFPKKCGVAKIFSLNDLNSSNMKILSHIVRDELDGFKSLQTRFPYEKERQDNLHSVLKTVLREFQVKPQYNVKKCFWITNSVEPYVNPELKDGLRTLVSDFQDNRIVIIPIFLDVFTDDQQLHRRPFDSTLYQHIFLNTNYLQESENDENDPFATGETPKWKTVTVALQIRLSIFRLTEVRRIQFACDLVLSDGPGIGGDLGCSIKGYSLYNHEKIKPFRQVSTEGDVMRLIHNDAKLHRSDTSAVIEKDESTKLVRGFPVKLSNDESEEQNEKVVYFTDDVLEYMKCFSFDHIPHEEGHDSDESDNSDAGEEEANRVSFSSPPYLKLLCFRDISQFQPYLNMKPSVFVTADLGNGLNTSSKDGGYSQSLLTFKSLYQSCVKLRRYAIVFGCIKRNSYPDLYAFYPTNTTNSTAGKGARELPDGFLLMNIPWLTEVRSLPDYMLNESERYFSGEKTSSQPELVNLYAKLIGQFAMAPYVPSESSNPVLSYFYKVIKNEALQIDIKGEEDGIEANDWSVARLLDMRLAATENVDAKELFLFINMLLNKVSNMEVVKRTAEENRLPSKKPKHEPLNEAAVITLWKNNAWSKVTVAQLKEFMARYDKIKSATRKADIVANISEFLELRQRR